MVATNKLGTHTKAITPDAVGVAHEVPATPGLLKPLATTVKSVAWAEISGYARPVRMGGGLAVKLVLGDC